MIPNLQAPKYLLPPLRPRALNLASPQADGLVAFYPLDDRNPIGTRLMDASLLGNNGTLSGAVSYGLEDGRSFIRFISGNATSPQNIGNNIVGPSISYGGWFNIPTEPGAFRLFLAKGIGSSNRHYSLFFAPNTTNSLYIALNGTTIGANGAFMTLSSSWVPNTWQHLYFTYTSGQTDIYLNGANVFSSIAYTGNVGSINSPLHIGSEGGSFPIAGRLADMRVYNRKLSAAEVDNIRLDGYTKLFKQNSRVVFKAVPPLPPVAGQIKTANNVSWAFIKTLNGVGSGSIKSVNGVLI